jgi:hypothetical protein
MVNSVDHVIRSRMRHVAGQRRCLVRYILELQYLEQEYTRSILGVGSSNYDEGSHADYLASAYYKCSKYAQLDAIARAADIAVEARKFRRHALTADIIDDVFDIMIIDTDSIRRRHRREQKDTSLRLPMRIGSPPRKNI